MELDDLRHAWKQPSTAETPPALLDASALTHLLAQQSGGIVEQLRRSARLELYINWGVLLGALLLAWLAPHFWLRVFGWVLTGIGVVCIGYLYHKLRLLRRMNDPAGDLHEHLGRLVSGLRALIRFYYCFTLAMLPVAGVVNVLIATSEFKRGIDLTSFLGILLVVGLVVVMPALLYLPVAKVTRRYLQRLYGQHLDRLETLLRELED